jgi:sulfite reductase (ferredoxin)
MPYTIPESLHVEIDALEEVIQQFLAGQLDPAVLKTRRVPFGIYEQRTPGAYMCRIRSTGGAISPAQLASLADLAHRYGSAFLHLTTREDVQIHDIEIGQIPSLLRDLAIIGLSSRGGGGNTVRNILVSPEAGHDPAELFDVGPWADALVERIIREKDSWNLPRKFKIAFSSSDRDTAMAGFNDLGFFPVLSPSGEQGFEVWAAGGLGGKPRPALMLRPWLPASEVHLATTAIKKFFDANGNRRNKRTARLRFLRDRFGDEGLMERLNQAIEDERAQGFVPLEPLAIRAAELPEATPQTQEVGYQDWLNTNVQIHPRTETALVRVPVLLGDLPSAIARDLGRGLASFGESVLRVGMRQDLVLVGVPAKRLPELHALLASTGLTKSVNGVEEVVACTGADTCKLGMCFPKGAVRALQEEVVRAGLAQGGFKGLRVHISGCPNSCAQHMVADLGFFGAARRQGERMYPAYRVVVGGTLGRGKARLARDIGQIPAKRLPEFVTHVLAAWRASGVTEFGTWIDGVGEEATKAIIAGLGTVPDWSVDTSPYFDWGATEAFSPTRGGAECSAGLFDLIDIDKESIQRERAKIDTEGATDSVAKAIVFHSSRMLLVAKEIQPTTPSGVYDGFLLGFISEGLVAERFRDLVVAARDEKPLAHRLAEVLELATTVEALYAAMDDSLRFSAPAPD